MMRRHLTSGRVGTTHLGIPGTEDPARIFATHPDVEAPDAELRYLSERVPQQRRWGSAGRVVGEWHDVLHPNEPQLTVLLRLVEQELGLDDVDRTPVLNERHVAVVEAHRSRARCAR